MKQAKRPPRRPFCENLLGEELDSRSASSGYREPIQCRHCGYSQQHQNLRPLVYMPVPAPSAPELRAETLSTQPHGVPSTRVGEGVDACSPPDHPQPDHPQRGSPSGRRLAGNVPGAPSLSPIRRPRHPSVSAHPRPSREVRLRSPSPGFAARERVSIDLHSRTVHPRTVRADAHGAGRVRVRIPAGRWGTPQADPTGLSSHRVVSTTITIVRLRLPPGQVGDGGAGPGVAGPGVAAGTGTAGTGVPVTGVPVLPYGVAAGGLLLGAALVVAGRRRRGRPAVGGTGPAGPAGSGGSAESAGSRRPHE